MKFRKKRRYVLGDVSVVNSPFQSHFFVQDGGIQLSLLNKTVPNGVYRLVFEKVERKK